MCDTHIYNPIVIYLPLSTGYLTTIPDNQPQPPEQSGKELEFTFLHQPVLSVLKDDTIFPTGNEDLNVINLYLEQPTN